MAGDGHELLDTMRHSAAHVMAKAVQRLFPGTRLAIGPAIANGFYYDLDPPEPIGEADLEKIEAEMARIVAADEPFERIEMSREDAIRHYTEAEPNPLKVELLEGIEDRSVTFYRTGEGWMDLCRGPHLSSSKEIGAYKLTGLAGAYWRGDERNPMLRRIYGTAWPTRGELDDYLRRLDEAQRRDHRKLGRELDLFMSSELVGHGLPILLPKGAVVRRLLEEFILDLERRSEYQHIYSPALAKVDMYKQSGHWEHYRENMFPAMALEHEEVVLRPMNCPHHALVYGSKLRSYRELPLRIAEIGTMYRYERSGVVGGLSRVRAMALNDAHIFCAPDQIKSEFAGVMQLVEQAYAVLGISDYSYRLSLRDPADNEKYVQNDAMWELGERVLREAMIELGLPFEEAPGEAAFYGPKVDIQIRDMLGREETMSTIQVDFHLPGRFDLTYIGEDGGEHRPVILHRGVIGTMERMMAYLIELYAGAFPLWLAPVQAVVVPIADRHNDYGGRVAAALRAGGIERVEMDARSERMNSKIRDAQLQKVPYMLIVGDREAEAEAVSLRSRSGLEEKGLPLTDCVSRLAAEAAERRLA